MKLKNLFTVAAAAVVACALLATAARAQSVSVFAGGLKAPAKIVMTPRGNLIVAEGGDGPNKGRLSLIDRKTHERRTVLDGLPAGPSGADGGPSGPSGIALEGNTLYVVIGGGDATLAGPAPGTEKPNPNPSSPLLSSVLAVTLPQSFDETNAQGPTLTLADHAALNGGATVTLSGGGGGKLSVELVANFADYEAAPRPDFAENVRVSNPFGIAVNGRLLYVVDASLNKVSIVGADSGAVATLTTIAPISNPLPFGPPFIDAVPDSVRLVGDSLLVPTLTGFPFPSSAASVRQINTVNGGQEAYVTNLTAAIDVLTYQGTPDGRKQQASAADKGFAEVRVPNGLTHYLALEFSTDFLQNAPGRLLIDSNDTNPIVLAEPLISPTSMARDPHSGDIFITSIFPGLVVRVSHARSLVLQHYRDFLGREPDKQGWDFWAGEIEKCGTDDACNDRKAVDVSRAFYYSAEFIGHHTELDQSLRGTAQYNREFVRQGYYAYLRRDCDPEVCDAAGFNFWVGKLNSRLPSRDADYNEMIRAFLVSAEYRARFGLQ